MIAPRALPKKCAGAAVVEYALLVAVASLGLIVNLPALEQGLCGVGDRVAQLLGTTSSACAVSGQGVGGPGGSGSGGGGSGGGGGGLTGNGGPGPGGGGGGGAGGNGNGG